MSQIVCLLLLAIAVAVQANPSVDTTIRAVTEHVALLGEGPYYVESEEAVYYVDIVRAEWIRADTRTGVVQRKTLGSAATSVIIPYQSGSNMFIASSENQLLSLNWATNEATILAASPLPDFGTVRFNDGKCDPRGRLFIGTVIENGTENFVPDAGVLYRLQGGTLVPVVHNLTISNGMAWSNDGGSEMYLQDSAKGLIYKFDYDIETGTPSNQRILLDTTQIPDFTGSPDGMAIDKYGYIWSALWGGGRIIKTDPTTGEIVDVVPLPRISVPTSLAFGDYQGHFGLFVTTDSREFAVPNPLDDGKLMHVALNGGDAPGYVP